MGSEVLIAGYGISAFLSLYLLKILNEQTRNENVEESLERRRNPVIIGFKILCWGMFFISIIGLGKAGIESYDYCEVLVVNETVNGSTTSFDYEKICFENSYNEDLNFQKFTFWIISIFGGLFLIFFLYEMSIHAITFIVKKFKKRKR